MNFTGAMSATDASTWSATLFNAIGNAWKTHMSSFVHLRELELTDLTSATGVQVVHAGDIAGLVVDGVVSNATCVVTEWEIARRYRGGKARTYWPGGTESATIDTESWDPTFVTNWTGDFDALILALDAAGPGAIGLAFMVAVSYFQGFTVNLRPPLRPQVRAALRVGGPVVDTITAAEVRSKFGTQRRRLQP